MTTDTPLSPWIFTHAFNQFQIKPIGKVKKKMASVILLLSLFPGQYLAVICIAFALHCLPK